MVAKPSTASEVSLVHLSAAATRRLEELVTEVEEESGNATLRLLSVPVPSSSSP
jgi:hypothetical protein